MKSLSKLRFKRARMIKQRGVVLFFALVALVVMSLAAVALIRSVDTSSMIAANLAFKQSATTSSDAGIEAAASWLAIQNNNNIVQNIFLTNPLNSFNTDNPPQGYFSYLDPTRSLTDSSGTGFQWTTADSVLVLPDPDSSGNSIRYIIQRMCRYQNQPITTADCAYSAPVLNGNNQSTPIPQDFCPPGVGNCPLTGQTPQIRITIRTIGPRNSISYVQAFVY